MNKVLLERAQLYRSRAEAAKTPDARLRWNQMAEYLDRLLAAEPATCPPHDFSAGLDGDVACSRCGAIEHGSGARAPDEAHTSRESEDDLGD